MEHVAEGTDFMFLSFVFVFLLLSFLALHRHEFCDISLRALTRFIVRALSIVTSRA